jgi:hypothetical protein
MSKRETTCEEWLAEHPGRKAIDYASWLDEEAYKRKPAAERREIEAEQEAYERERNARSGGSDDLAMYLSADEQFIRERLGALDWQRVADEPRKYIEDAYHQIILDLLRSPIPLSRWTRERMAGEFQRLWQPEKYDTKLCREQAFLERTAVLQDFLAGFFEQQGERAPRTKAAEALGMKIGTLHRRKRRYRANARKRI